MQAIRPYIIEEQIYLIRPNLAENVNKTDVYRNATEKTGNNDWQLNMKCQMNMNLMYICVHCVVLCDK